MREKAAAPCDACPDETIQRKFHSVGEFLRDLMKTLKLFIKRRKSLNKMDPRFRESICLAVTLENNCAL